MEELAGESDSHGINCDGGVGSDQINIKIKNRMKSMWKKLGE